MTKKEIKMIDINNIKPVSALENINVLYFESDIDFEYILDRDIISGISEVEKITTEMIEKVVEDQTNENGLYIRLKTKNDDTFHLAESIIGFIINSIVNREVLRRDERLLGLSTIEDSDNMTGGVFNLLSVINYQSPFDYIKIVILNKDETKEKGFGFLV